MIVRKIWFNRKKLERHAGKLVEMRGWYLFGFIPLYVVEYQTIG